MNSIHNNKHPIIKQKLTLGQRWADKITIIVGSWWFIFSILLLIFIWMLINTILIIEGIWDPYPFILLNFVLSCLAALQAPIILMSQNREAQKDRIRVEYDYKVNRKAEREISSVQRDLGSIKRLLKKK